MPGGGSESREDGGAPRPAAADGGDWVDVLLFIVARAAAPIIVLGGGFQAWRRWSDNSISFQRGAPTPLKSMDRHN